MEIKPLIIVGRLSADTTSRHARYPPAVVGQGATRGDSLLRQRGDRAGGSRSFELASLVLKIAVHLVLKIAVHSALLTSPGGCGWYASRGGDQVCGDSDQVHESGLCVVGLRTTMRGVSEAPAAVPLDAASAEAWRGRGRGRSWR